MNTAPQTASPVAEMFKPQWLRLPALGTRCPGYRARTRRLRIARVLNRSTLAAAITPYC
jgi:hypothetical protein